MTSCGQDTLSATNQALAAVRTDHIGLADRAPTLRAEEGTWLVGLLAAINRIVATFVRRHVRHAHPFPDAGPLDAGSLVIQLVPRRNWRSSYHAEDPAPERVGNLTWSQIPEYADDPAHKSARTRPRREDGCGSEPRPLPGPSRVTRMGHGPGRTDRSTRSGRYSSNAAGSRPQRPLSCGDPGTTDPPQQQGNRSCCHSMTTAMSSSRSSSPVKELQVNPKRVVGPTTSQHLRQQVHLGAVAGLFGTAAMTVPILLGRRLGLLTTPPPVEITANVAHRTSLLPDPSRPGFPLLWPAAHLAYGAGAGMGFVVIRDRLPARTALAGLLYGATVWAMSYLGILPALSLYPGPTQDSRSREAVMIVAHGVFGLSVAATTRHLARP